MIEAPARLARRGVETKLVIEADGADPAPDPALIKAVARGQAWFEDLVSGKADSVRTIARREGVTPRYVALSARTRLPAAEAGRGHSRGHAACEHDGRDADAG